jgi:hypothetical protein
MIISPHPDNWDLRAISIFIPPMCGEKMLELVIGIEKARSLGSPVG